MKNTKRIMLLFYFSIFYMADIYSQTEYFVKVDPKSGNFKKVKNIPGVNWIQVAPSYLTFDENNQVYFFKGDDSTRKFCLYSINAGNGKVISKPVFPTLTNPKDNVIELQYDNNTKKLYGLHWKDSLKTEFLVSINPSNGAFTIIDSIPGVKWIASTTFTIFDEKNHLFIFKGADYKMDWRLYAVDVTSGKVISKPQFPNLSDSRDNISDIKYNNTTQSIYGLHWDNSESMEYIVSIDRATSNMTLIDSLPGLKWINIIPNYSSIDENKNLFIFRGADKNMTWYLYSIDLSNGQIVNKVRFPKVCNPADNVIELHFSKNSNQLYGLHWEDRSFKRLRDTAICFNSFILFDVPFSSKWSNGDTGKLLYPLTTGYYSYEKLNSCDSSTRRDTLFIRIKGSKAFIGNDTTYCNNFSTMLYPQKNYLTYSWNTGSKDKVTYVKNAGTYILTVTDSSKCNSSDTITLSISSIPFVYFVVDNYRQCINVNSFNLTNRSSLSNGSLTYKWNLGDGKKSTLENVKNLSYLTADTFIIRLIAISDKNCTDSFKSAVITLPNPKAEFTILKNSDCWQNDLLKIVNTTTQEYDSMLHDWNFGDGTKDFSRTPTNKKYDNKTAEYVIKYKVFSNHGCTDYIERKVSFLEKPLSAFSINDSIQCLNNNNFLFSDMTRFSNQSALGYLWDFGNGTASSDKTPQTIKYKTSGKYTVQLITNSSDNCKDTITKIVEVNPHANASFIAKDVCDNNHVVFINKSINAINYKWKFGDGKSSFFKSPSHLYTINGISRTFNVTLVGLSTQGCSDSITNAVTVNANPIADFTILSNQNVFNFKAIQTGNTKYMWIFGNGDSATSTINEIGYIYPAISRKYNACLIVTNASGCYTQTCKEAAIILDISSYNNTKSFLIYPNPTDGKVRIELPLGASATNISIWNISGQMIFDNNLSDADKDFEVDLKSELGLKSGIYFIRVQNAATNHVVKVVMY